MPSLSAYHLTWVSLTLDVGYLFTAVPAKNCEPHKEVLLWRKELNFFPLECGLDLMPCW